MPVLQESRPAVPLWAPTECQFLDPELGRQKGTAGLQGGRLLASLVVLGGDDTPALIEAFGLRYPSLAQGQCLAWGHSWEGRGQTRARVS